MMRLRYKSRSLYVKLLIVILVAIAVATASFFFFSAAYDKLATYYVSHTSQFREHADELASEFQSYISENRIASADSTEIQTWVNGIREMDQMIIYRDGKPLYDSFYPGEDETFLMDNSHTEDELPEWYDWCYSYETTFFDGKAETYLAGFFPFTYYTIASYASIISAFIIFILVVMLAIGREMKKLHILSEDVAQLTDGDLSHEVKVTSMDEIGYIANSINAMRLSLQENIREREGIAERSRKVISEASHDLRTPLTSLILYSDILEQRRFDDEEQMWDYISKINAKARHIKTLSDNIFRYSIDASLPQEVWLERGRFEDIFPNQIADMQDTLGHSGFKTDVSGDLPPVFLELNPDYILRVFENITSNIMKYADPKHPVTIRFLQTEQNAGLSIRNMARKDADKSNSTGIGTRNINKMMQAMHGIAEVFENDQIYQITLLFPYTR